MKKTILDRLKVLVFIFAFVSIVVLGYRFFLTSQKVQEYNLSHFSINKSLKKENVIPVAIIGSGPAGLSAALYGARGGFYSVVFEGKEPGGQLMGTTWVENWPGMEKKMGPDLIKSLRDQAKEFGAFFVQDTITDVNFSSWPYQLKTEGGSTIHALSVILATGAQARKLGIPGEDEFWGTGVTACAICDAPFFKDKEVFVVGGGDSAAEEAMQLAPYAKKITLLVRRDAMRASAAMQERLRAYDHISIQYNTQLSAIKGEGKRVTNVDMIVNGKKKNAPIDGVFLAIGHTPNSSVFKKYVKTDSAGYVDLQGHTQNTSVPGVFAAGDVSDRMYSQAGVAAGDGIKAALDASEFLRDIGFNEIFAEKLESQYFDAEGGVGREPLQSFNSLDEFEQYVKKTDVPIFLDFYTEFCPSCAQMIPSIEKLAMELKGSMEFYKVDAMKVPGLSEKYEVESVPTFIVVRQGELVARAHNSMSRKELRNFVENVLN